MPYTLKMTSIPWHAKIFGSLEWIEKSVKELTSDGWEAKIVCSPFDVNHSTTDDFSRHIEIHREISFFDQIANYWNMLLTGEKAASISVTFPDANIYRGSGKRESTQCFNTFYSAMGKLSWKWDCRVLDAVEISVDGGYQWGEDNMHKFFTLLYRWHRKFWVIRKADHLVGRAWDRDQGGIDRLLAEIRAGVSTL